MADKNESVVQINDMEETNCLNEPASQTNDGDEIFDAMDEEDVERVHRLLQDSKININCRIRRPPDMQSVSLMQLAAQKNNFTLVKLLRDNDADPMDKPRPPVGYREDLSDVTRRLMLYDALSRPAYLILMNEDPVNAALELSENIHALSNSKGVYDTFKDKYMTLEERVKDLAVELLDCCYSGEEVRVLLHGPRKPSGSVNEDLFRPQTVMRAIELGQKEFVAHPKCQHVIRAEWLNGQPEWSERNGWRWMVLYSLYCWFVYAFCQPLLALVHVLAPCTPLSKIIETPKARFLMYLWSYSAFILLFFCFGVIHYLLPYATINYSIIYYSLLIWVMAMLWRELQQRMFHGQKIYSSDLWNILDVVIVVSLLTILLLYLVITKNEIDISTSVEWTVVFNLSAFILVLSCLRFMQNFYLNTVLGPMLLTFTCMTSDIYRFLCLFSFIVCSFAVGFFYVYTEVYPPNEFSGLGSSVKQLLFSIFGKESTSSLDATLEKEIPIYSDSGVTQHGNEVIANATNGRNLTLTLADDAVSYVLKDFGYIYTTMGLTLYGLFCIIVMLVLLNLCIAMMSDTYTKIKENIDVEWKFVRTCMWLDFFVGPVLPPPFNLIPSPESMSNVVRRLFRRVLGKRYEGVRNEDSEMEMRNPKERLKSAGLTYEELMQILGRRYMKKRGQEYAMVRCRNNDPVHLAPDHASPSSDKNANVMM
ncbi:short transient receptor potential channel 4-like [Ptychodera flava]|uniref:short transient receptor potential channel 4-like n=1 Tax=Ptychodera flava TaxID=63121 RepID=UPI00396A6075